MVLRDDVTLEDTTHTLITHGGGTCRRAQQRLSLQLTASTDFQPLLAKPTDRPGSAELDECSFFFFFWLKRKKKGQAAQQVLLGGQREWFPNRESEILRLPCVDQWGVSESIQLPLGTIRTHSSHGAGFVNPLPPKLSLFFAKYGIWGKRTRKNPAYLPTLGRWFFERARLSRCSNVFRFPGARLNPSRMNPWLIWIVAFDLLLLVFAAVTPVGVGSPQMSRVLPPRKSFPSIRKANNCGEMGQLGHVELGEPRPV